jgi:hypothetical protein
MKNRNGGKNQSTMAKEQNKKASGVAEPEISEFEKTILAQIQDWESVDTGFPPYWKPRMGECIVARVCTLDARNENFIRYVMQATKVAIPCARGPVDGAEEVVVNPGEFFTMGEYASLDLTRFFDIEVFIKVTGERKLPGNADSNGVPRRLFEFDVRCSKEDHLKLKKMRDDDMKLLMARRTMGTRQLAEATA